jgi:AAA+ superfamily predicted ATPase
MDMSTRAMANSKDLDHELIWFGQIVKARIENYFDNATDDIDLTEIVPPDLAGSTSQFANLVSANNFGFAERLMLILALAPYIRPNVLDVFNTRNKAFDRPFTEFGGCRKHGNFWPTCETVIFLLSGTDLYQRFQVLGLFEQDHAFASRSILHVDASEQAETPLGGRLQPSPETIGLLTSGKRHRPAYGPDFPAQRIETDMTWDSLVLTPSTRTKIAEIETWIEHGETLMTDWQMGPKLRPGYRSLFYGPPGTGKSMTASLLGAETGHDVYRIDLSMVVSKYIGETEKNLARVFDQAQSHKWILFFDEADALFGKRGQTQSSNDRHANQEVAYLLQRIETFDGIAILASNLKDNIDDAFARRFESVIHFPMPQPEQRLRLWQQGLSSKAVLSDNLDLAAIARDHKLSGGAIMNVIRYVSLEGIRRGDGVIAHDDIVRGVHREYVKEGIAV